MTTVRVRLCPRYLCKTEFWKENTIIMVLLNSEKCCLCALDGPQMLQSAHSARDHITRPMTQGTQIRRGSTGLHNTLCVTPVEPFNEHASDSTGWLQVPSICLCLRGWWQKRLSAMEKRVWEVKGPQGEEEKSCPSSTVGPQQPPPLPPPTWFCPRAPSPKTKVTINGLHREGRYDSRHFQLTPKILWTQKHRYLVVTFYSRAVQRSFLQWHKCPTAALSNIAAISQTQLVGSWNTASASEEVNTLPNFNSHIRLLAIVWKNVVNIQHHQFARKPNTWMVQP